MPLAPGQTLNNRYRIVRLLGQGGFGAVYRAWDTNLERPRALKENLDTSEEAQRQFKREAQILADLAHPNLPRVLDHFAIPGQGQYLVMDFVEGLDLQAMLDERGPMTEAQALPWILQVCDALIYLHSQDPAVIHRDIKPANIKITPEGRAMLVDFGIAKVYDPYLRTTMGARAVTPGYSPIEQYGSAGRTDARTDVYALGATLYALLTGHVPLEAPERNMSADFPHPRLLNPSISPIVEATVLRALEIQPERRFQSVADFKAALQSTKDDRKPEKEMVFTPRTQVTPVSVAPPRPTIAPPNSATAPRRLPLAWIGAAGVVILVGIVGLALGIYFIGHRAAPTKIVSQNPTQAQPVIATSVQSVNVPQTGPVKVAILAPLSGAVPTFGVSTRDGALQAIKEWNDKGGVLGKQIEADVQDSQCTADPAVNAANKVIDQDKVHYIIGEVCSKASIPVSEIANAKKVVQISPTSTNTQVTLNIDGTTKQYIFRACFIDPFQGLVMAKFANGKGYKSAFIMFDQGNDYVRGLAEAFEKAFTQLGGQIVGKETYTSQDTDFSAILAKVKDANPDVLYLPDYYNIVNLVGKQAKEKGVTAVMMGGDGWDSSDLDVTAADGGFYSNHYDPGDTRPIVVDWLKRYGAAYKDDKGQPKVPDALATLAYDATNLLLNAIKAAGTDDPTAVAKALEGIKMEGVSGTITFDAQHNPIKAAAVIGVAGGKKTFVESVAP